MSFKHTLVIFMTLFTCFTAFSQVDFKPFRHLGLGIKASTLGYGFEATTTLSNLFILRLGVNLTEGLNIGKYNFDLPDSDGDLYKRFGYIPDYRVKPGLKLTHGNLLLDFHPAGIFHITVGAFIGESKFKLSGQLVNPNHKNEPAKLLPGYNWPVVEVGDREVELTNGRADLELKLGKSIFKPYLGLGLGRALPKNNRISFKLELGVLLQKGYSIKANGEVLDFSSSDEQEFIDIHDNLTSYIKFWPMLNLQFSFRIF